MNISPQSVKDKLLTTLDEMQNNSWLYTKEPKDFTRKRKISFSDTILSTITMQKDASKEEVLNYFGFQAGSPTASALIQQRNKIPTSTYETVYRSFTNSFNLDLTIKGYDPIAVDGSDIYIPRNPTDTDTYRISDQYGKGFNMLHLNASYNLMSHLYIDAIIQPFNQINEYLAICDMIDHYAVAHPTRKPLYIADRGFVSLNVFAHAIENNAFFLIRARDSESGRNLLSMLELPDSPGFDIKFERWLTRRNTKTIKAEPEVYKSVGNRVFDFLAPSSKSLYYICFRIVRFVLPNGQTETVFTNLPVADFSHEELMELYHMRWGIETSFRDIKYAAGLLYFHSKKKELILQEIYAKLILYNYCELITGSIALKEKGEKQKYQYTINFNLAIAVCTEFLKKIHTVTPDDVIALISRELVPIRPGRSNPRYIRARTARSFQYR